ncbi:MAG TPA: hypothetical protein VE959_28465 [Bryobacteraceae bacterium]|nr:hypothetical protein [Bryobacteraceae bacterium]
MDSTAGALGGVVILALFLIGLVFLVMLFVAPIKLYAIHREIQETNALLKQQNATLAQQNDRNQAQVRLLAAIANMTKTSAASPGSEGVQNAREL